MRATAAQTDPSEYANRVRIRDHELVVDEPQDHGGQDEGPTPQELLAASLAACTSITIEMYARRKGWDIGPVEVEVDYDQPERDAATRFRLVLRLSDTCTDEQLERIRAIAARCPVHRTLEGEISFEDTVERVSPRR